LLALLIEVFRRHSKIPEKRNELYDKQVDATLMRHKGFKHLVTHGNLRGTPPAKCRETAGATAEEEAENTITLETYDDGPVVTVPKEEAEIALETCDNHVVKVPKSIAELSGFIKGMIEDADEGNGESIEVVPLKEHKSCTRNIITRVVEYLKKHAEFEASSSDDEVRPDIHTMFLCVLFADIRWQEVTCVLTYVVLWV
jgi:hypothetical protein